MGNNRLTAAAGGALALSTANGLPPPFPSDPSAALERTCFQTAAVWSANGNLRSDVAIVYGIGPGLLARIEQLRQQGARIIESIPVPAKALQQEGIVPIIAHTSCLVHWKARQLDDGMLFFLSNFAKTGTFEATLRASGKIPMLCDPVTGEVRILANHRPDGDGIRIRIAVRDTADAYFIVVRDGPARPSVVAVHSGGAEVSPADLDLSFDSTGTLVAESAKPDTNTLRVLITSTTKAKLSIGTAPVLRTVARISVRCPGRQRRHETCTRQVRSSGCSFSWRHSV